MLFRSGRSSSTAALLSPHRGFPVRCWSREMTPVPNPSESGVRGAGGGARAPRLAPGRRGSSQSSAPTTALPEGLASAPSGSRPRRKHPGVFDSESVPLGGKGAHTPPDPHPPRRTPVRPARPRARCLPASSSRDPQYPRHTYAPAPPGHQTPVWRAGGRRPRRPHPAQPSPCRNWLTDTSLGVWSGFIFFSHFFLGWG